MAGPGRIILTRERERNRVWAHRLDEAAIPHAELPLIRHTALPPPRENPCLDHDWILFTSPGGVRAFAAWRPQTGHARFGALGRATAAALGQTDWPTNFAPGAHDAQTFAAAFLAVITPPCRVLLPGALCRLGEPHDSLQAAGCAVTALPLYTTDPAPTAEIAAALLRPGDTLFFCSPSAVNAFVAARDDRPSCVAIGETTAAACRAADFTPAVAATPDLGAMLRAAGWPGQATHAPVTTNPELDP